MSRVGKKLIPIPEKTKITYTDRVLSIQGEKGVLTRKIHPDVDLKIDDKVMSVTVDRNDKKTKGIMGNDAGLDRQHGIRCIQRI